MLGHLASCACKAVLAIFQGESLEDQIADTDRQADRARLKLFLEAVKNSRLPRALDLASRMNTTMALEGALKLVNNYRWGRHGS